MSNFPNSYSTEKEEQNINLKQLFEQYAFFWKWFIVSILICILGAFIYLRYADKIYNITAKILLQDENKPTGELAGLSEIAALGGLGGSSSAFVSDQIDVMKSRRIFRKVVEQNRFNIIYAYKGNVKSSEMVEFQSPIRLVLLESNNSKLDSLTTTFIVKKNKNNIIVDDNVNGSRVVGFGQKINSSLGQIMFLPQGNQQFLTDIIISYEPINKTVDKLLKEVQINPNKEKQSYVVNFAMNSRSIEKAELLLNSLIDQYNKDVTEDKTKVTRATSDFIDSRLELISKDLSSADTKVADFKDQNNLIDMNSEVQLYMQNASENERKLIEYQTQLRLAEMMGGAIRGSKGNLLP